MNKNRLLQLLLLLSALGLLLSGCEGKKPGIRAGDLPPGFELRDLTGREVRMPGDFGGKVVVIRFWADWCASCREEMPAMDAVYRQYGSRGLVILAVNVKQTKEVAERFAGELSLTYPVLLDQDAKVAKAYGVKGLPTTFILDRQGRVKEKILGEVQKDVFEKMVKGLL